MPLYASSPRSQIIGLFLLVGLLCSCVGLMSAGLVYLGENENAVLLNAQKNALDAAAEDEDPPASKMPVEQESNVVDIAAFLVDPSCDLLGGDPPAGTVCFPRDARTPPVVIPVAEGGFSLISLGSGSLNNQAVGPVAEHVGHIVVFPGVSSDGTTPKDLNVGITLTNYIPGSVSVTHITALHSFEEALAAGSEHAAGMLRTPPNCGASGCTEVHLWLFVEGKIEHIEMLTLD